MQQSFDKIGRSLKSIGSKMTATISAPLLGAGALAVKTAADYERLQIQINTLAGSAEKGAKIFKDLQEFSAGTPFQLGDLAKANNILVGMGQTSDDAFTNLKMLGDVASATGANINELAVTFGQASAEGKLMSRDIREFINRGVPLTKLLADSMGVAKDQIFDLASQGKISFEVVRKALEDATTGTGIYAGATEKAANSIHGVLSTLRDNVARITSEIGNIIVEELDLKDLIKDMTASVQEGIKWFSSLSSEAKKMGISFAGLAIALGPVITGLGIISMAAAAISGPVLAAVAGIGLAATLIIKNWDDIVKYFTSGDGAKMWDTLKETVQDTVKLVTALWDMFGTELLELTKDSFSVIVTTVDGALKQINNLVGFWSKVFVGDFKGALGEVGDSFKNWSFSIIDIVKGIAVGLGKWLWFINPPRIAISTLIGLFRDAGEEGVKFGVKAAEGVGILRKEFIKLNNIANQGLSNVFAKSQDDAWQFGKAVNQAGNEMIKALSETYAFNQSIGSLIGSMNRYAKTGQDSVDVTSIWKASMGGATTSTEAWAEAQKKANEYLKNTKDLLPQISQTIAPLQGSLGGLQERLRMLQAGQKAAMSPEVYNEIQVLIDEVNAKIQAITGTAQQSGQAMMGLANSIGQVFSQAVLHAQNLEDVVKNLLKQLASKAFVIGIGALLTGGASLGKSTFLEALFGGSFHTGGIVKGSGDKMIRAKGGEMVLTKSQQKALNMGGGQSMSINPNAIGQAVARELDKRIKPVSGSRIFELSQQGRTYY